MWDQIFRSEDLGFEVQIEVLSNSWLLTRQADADGVGNDVGVDTGGGRNDIPAKIEMM